MTSTYLMTSLIINIALQYIAKHVLIACFAAYLKFKHWFVYSSKPQDQTSYVSKRVAHILSSLYAFAILLNIITLFPLLILNFTIQIYAVFLP